jgi:cellulose biosynthesis protein BcsQ
MGKILTFYSYKGGVGRTMALANVGLLAAMNGKRVLLMDWDLEAPGLAYYFRGLLGRREEIDLRDAAGILNILTAWREQISPSLTADQLDRIKFQYNSGVPFQSCVRSLIEPAVAESLLSGASCLHFISAGSSHIDEVNSSYEKTLSDFSWSDFFSDKVGGYLLERLQTWAKQNYDFVLIDSRTGLADAAGICTMMLPDEVALCFALNHQNIEGVARVAKSIRTFAQDTIKVRSLPMRVARRDSSESSDAQARAISTLTQTGGLSGDDVKSDIQSLSVPFDDSLPFYETLAPFAAQGTDPSLDPLTLAYLRLTKVLLGMDVALPEISVEIVKKVRERLSPRNATAQYVSDLQFAEPSRAYAELLKFIEIAQDAVLEKDILDRDYVEALSACALDLIDKVDEVEEGFDLLSRAIELVRMLVERQPKEWTDLYIQVIQDSLFDITLYGRKDEEYRLRIELERYLANSQSVASKVTRLGNLQELARIEVARKRGVQASQYLEVTRDILAELMKIQDLEEDQLRSLTIVGINTSILGSDVSLEKGESAKARTQLENGLAELHSIPRRLSEEVGEELNGLQFKLHFKLAMLPEMSEEERGEHCISAAESGATEFTFKFIEISVLVSSLKNAPDQAVAFCERALAQSRRRRLLQYYARTPMRVGDYLDAHRVLLKNFGTSDGQNFTLLLAQSFADTMLTAGRQKYAVGQHTKRIIRISEEFIGRLHSLEFSEEQVIESIEKSLSLLKSRRVES